jgi:pyruvate/2-oxoglutarate dehydrogenase complex dihydrolipoamide dehydrogenase (E3) component
MSPIEALLPERENNRELEENVRPPGYRNPTPADSYNLVVIGAGTAGLVTAAGAAGMGAKVALIERSLMGGDCLNVGCVPSKGIISAARAVSAVRKAGEFGVHVPEGVSVDFSAAMKRMRKLRASISANDSVNRFAGLGVDVFLGQGRFLDSSTIEVDGTRISFKKAVIATGARAAVPPIKGLDTVDYLTNETLFSLTELPRRFGIIGGGPIGCEMAQTFARLGSEVFLIESSSGILGKEDPDAASLVAEQMKKDGVQILSHGKELVVSKQADGSMKLEVTVPGEEYAICVDQLLVAAGRTPNVEGMGLEAVGVDYTKKGIVVDNYLRTTNPSIYAAGDICSPYQFTHAADFMARTVIRNALFMGRARVDKLIIPWCTYTSPEVAHVGLTAGQAEEKGIEIDTFTQELSEVDRAILDGETEGFVRIHVKKGKDEIVGATIVASHAGDMMGLLTAAMTRKIGLGSIANIIHPYPTQGEAVRKVGDLYNRTRLTPVVKRLFEKWLSWTR